MPRVKRRLRERLSISPGQIAALAIGNFFGDFANDDEMREAWMDPDARVAARRYLAERRMRDRYTREIPWAEEKFGAIDDETDTTA